MYEHSAVSNTVINMSGKNLLLVIMSNQKWSLSDKLLVRYFSDMPNMKNSKNIYSVWSQ